MSEEISKGAGINPESSRLSRREFSIPINSLKTTFDHIGDVTGKLMLQGALRYIRDPLADYQIRQLPDVGLNDYDLIIFSRATIKARRTEASYQLIQYLDPNTQDLIAVRLLISSVGQLGPGQHPTEDIVLRRVSPHEDNWVISTNHAPKDNNQRINPAMPIISVLNQALSQYTKAVKRS